MATSLLSLTARCLLRPASGILVPRRTIQSNAVTEAFLGPAASQHGVACLFLNRPDTKNAISLRMLEELHESLDTLHRIVKGPDGKTARVLILRSSTPDSFCAGADLAERRKMSAAQVDRFLADLRSALAKLETLPIPTIAAIDGPALGGGLEMSLACDLRVAGYNVTKIGLPETKLGIIPAAGGTQRATRLLGIAKAKDLIFTGRMLDAQDALKMGLVEYVSAPEQTAFDKALALAETIAQNAPLALRSAKASITQAVDTSLEEGLDFERASYEVLLSSKDRVEALQAFKEKRRPVFMGE